MEDLLRRIPIVSALSDWWLDLFAVFATKTVGTGSRLFDTASL